MPNWRKRHHFRFRFKFLKVCAPQAVLGKFRCSGI